MAEPKAFCFAGVLVEFQAISRVSDALCPAQRRAYTNSWTGPTSEKMEVNCSSVTSLRKTSAGTRKREGEDLQWDVGDEYCFCGLKQDRVGVSALSGLSGRGLLSVSHHLGGWMMGEGGGECKEGEALLFPHPVDRLRALAKFGQR